MSAESYLSRELDIRFIDARVLVNEAKLNLNIHGYMDKEQQILIQREAIRLFKLRGRKEALYMRRANWELDSVKIPNGSMSLSDWQDSSKPTSPNDELNKSSHTLATESSKSSSGSLLRGKLFGRRY